VFSKTFIPFSVLLFTLGLSGNAWASSSWSSQPSWAASPPTTDVGARKSGSYNRSVSTSESRYNIAPFSPGSHNVALEIGQVFLMGDLGDNYNDSIGTQLHYTYGVSDMFGFDSSLGYSDHSDGGYSQTTLLAGLRTNLAWYDKVIPYVTFGLGFYKPSYKFPQVGGYSTSASPILFGLHLGPGVDLEITKQFFFGAALTFHNMFGTTKMTTQGERELGGTYTSFNLRAGVTF
jgi:hypothetical protein